MIKKAKTKMLIVEFIPLSLQGKGTYGVMAITEGLDPSDPGPIPGRSFTYYLNGNGSYSVVVSTVDSESTTPGANPGRTFALYFPTK
jgi:hypothetical protein